LNKRSEKVLLLFRFSISWSRLLPNGFTNHISEDATKYYNDLINGLLEKGIQPAVTMYHWELPQRLQDLGETEDTYILLTFNPQTVGRS
jgi:beta-glucosidase/6-phospho-beta-glucosidase/beta-galactosidase